MKDRPGRPRDGEGRNKQVRPRGDAGSASEKQRPRRPRDGRGGNTDRNPGPAWPGRGSPTPTPSSSASSAGSAGSENPAALGDLNADPTAAPPVPTPAPAPVPVPVLVPPGWTVIGQAPAPAWNAPSIRMPSAVPSQAAPEGRPDPEEPLGAPLPREIHPAPTAGPQQQMEVVGQSSPILAGIRGLPVAGVAIGGLLCLLWLQARLRRGRRF
ncbi:hypothetical protein [Planobispora longispora]|uniref:hypothetical protein n=1 Tax=Planobispora longispora TaxID=28887 RepID=UPI001943C2F7|nr:hypothetical protein [Planobispora longispora]BFE83498.1 hypothetical protein GCM10020093_060990 [Planobispora longispora]